MMFSRLFPVRSRFLSFFNVSRSFCNDIRKRIPSCEPYFAGLKNTVMTTELKICEKTQTIPIYRVLNVDGSTCDGFQNPFSDDATVDIYKSMVRLQIWDDMFYNIQRQGRISFYIQNQGEEGLQTGVGLALKQNDHIFSQYRELGILLSKGMPIEQVLYQLFSTARDEGKGRQMPISYSQKAINLHTISTPLTTQVPHAAGAGYAFKLETDTDKVAVTGFGEGAASEGDFHAAMNFAAVRKSQTIFVCRNNGYAISTPVCDQYAGDGIAIRGLSYGMKSVRIDGNDFFASYIATKEARRICVENSEPICMEFMTYRAGHHSTSDESSQYRIHGEMDKWVSAAYFAIPRMKLFLERNSMWNEQEEHKLRKEAKSYMLKLIKQIETEKKFPILGGIFDDVYDKMPWHIKEQRDELAQHLKTFGSKYKLNEYQSIE